MSDFSRDILDRLGLDRHRGRPSRCPFCAGSLLVEELPRLGKGSTDLCFFCPNCQCGGEYECSDATDTWTAAEIKQLLDNFVQYGKASCPRDTAMLRFFRDPSLGSRLIIAICPHCGRDAQQEPTLTEASETSKGGLRT